MKKIIIIIILISTKLFSQVIVHSKNDKRLLAYRDSVKCYLCGLEQLNVAKRIKDREDSACGRKAYYFLEKYGLQCNTKIKPISYVKEFPVTFVKGVATKEIKKIDNNTYLITTYTHDSVWYPDIYKKPALVIYKPLPKPNKPIVKIDTEKKKTIILVYKLNGQTVSKEQFERFYGKKTNS